MKLSQLTKSVIEQSFISDSAYGSLSTRSYLKNLVQDKIIKRLTPDKRDDNEGYLGARDQVQSLIKNHITKPLSKLSKKLQG